MLLYLALILLKRSTWVEDYSGIAVKFKHLPDLVALSTGVGGGLFCFYGKAVSDHVTGSKGLSVDTTISHCIKTTDRTNDDHLEC